MKASDSRILSLDGIRAICIVLVLLGHLSGTRGIGEIDLGIGDYAHLGVNVFFLISGYLITRLLAKEELSTGAISLKLFYIRRTIRIFPASYGYILFILILQWAGVHTLATANYVHAATYTINYFAERSWELGHLWSLSVEEQFYLVWPFCFYLAGARRAAYIAIAGALLGPAARVFGWYFLRDFPMSLLAPLPMMADSLAIGCFLALKEDWLKTQRWYGFAMRPAVGVSMLALLLLMNRLMAYSIVNTVGLFCMNLMIGLLVHRCILYPEDALGRILNSRPLVAIGVLSYSLYVWQQFFLHKESTLWVTAFPQNLILSVLMAILSYRLLEKPMLQLRHRLRRS